MNFLLDSNLGENLKLGGEVVLVGVMTVFAVLGIIWAFLMVFKLVFSDMKQGARKIPVESKPAPEVVAPVVTSGDEEEIIAVLAAAIAAAETEYVGLKFRVVSYRRK